MEINNTLTIAEQNLGNLKNNPYPGRVIIIGVDETRQNLVQIYAIMGRSTGSRNRIFDHEGGRVFTQVADSTKEVGDPSLTLYNAMCEDGVHFVVSNGSQTDNLITALRCGKEFDDGILGNQYEPDKPNYTQRITGICALDSVYTAELSILRKSASDDSCDRCFYQYEAIPPGFGRFISTYSGDGSPLPPFRSEPLIMPLIGHSIEFVAETYWAALNEANRVSLAVKFISKTTRKSEVKVINKFVRV